MSALVVVLLVLMVLAAAGAAYGVHHRRQRAGRILGVDRPSSPPQERQA